MAGGCWLAGLGFRVSWSRSGGTGECGILWPEAKKSTDLRSCQEEKGRSLPPAGTGGALGAQGDARSSHSGSRNLMCPQPRRREAAPLQRVLGSQKADSKRRGSYPSLCSLLKASLAVEVNPEHLSASQVRWASQQGRLCDLCCKGRFPSGCFDRRGSGHTPRSLHPTPRRFLTARGSAGSYPYLRGSQGRGCL